MRDIADELLGWVEAGDSFAIASIVSIRGSAPRGVGATAAVRSDGTVLGSLSGGCVEGAVYETALRTLTTGQPERVEFDHDPNDPFAVGLTCGGTLDVHIRPVDSDTAACLRAALAALCDGSPVAMARLLDSGTMWVVDPIDSRGGTGDAELDRRVVNETRGMLSRASTGLRRICVPDPNGPAEDEPASERELFVEAWNTPARMLIFGAIDHAAALARMGKFLGYHVTVCDARAVFTTPQRFPDADEVVVEWPHEHLAATETDQRTVICVLTHDPKFDVPVLREALRGQAAYVGALGSRHTHTDRLRRLRSEGLDDTELARLRAPIGLDLGGRSPEETAVSIGAEIVSLRNGACGLPLTDTSGPIHPHA